MEKVGLKFGLFTAAALIIYFLLMKLIGLEAMVQLRFLNGIIMAVGIAMAIRAYRKLVNGKIRYFSGLGVGFLTASVATLLFAAFMLLYIKAFDSTLIEVLTADKYFGDRMMVTPGIVIFMVLVVEGLISGYILSFIAMQYFKRRDHKVPGSP